MKNTHQQHRVRTDTRSPPPGRNDDDTQALQAGRHGTSPRRSAHSREESTRDSGSDDRRSGSESGRDKTH